jgi:hypothetical protein
VVKVRTQTDRAQDKKASEWWQLMSESARTCWKLALLNYKFHKIFYTKRTHPDTRRTFVVSSQGFQPSHLQTPGDLKRDEISVHDVYTKESGLPM